MKPRDIALVAAIASLGAQSELPRDPGPTLEDSKLFGGSKARRRRERAGLERKEVPADGSVGRLYKARGRFARTVARNARTAKRWKAMFREIPVDRDGNKVRVRGTPPHSKRQAKLHVLEAAREIRPAIKTVRGAKKLEKLIERGRAGAV